jgi:type I restriction enzyme, S subunit
MTHNVEDKNSENDSYINGELTGEIQCNLNKNTELNASANNSVEYIELEKIFDIRNGYTPSKKEPSFWNNGNIPWFRMEDIRGNGSILNDSKQHVTKEAVKKSGLFNKNSILLATTATIGVHAIITCEYLANQRFTNFSIRKEFENKIMPKFAYYYFFKIDSWCLNNVNISNFASVDVSRMKQLIIPIPPIDVQREIVRILDRFEHLCSDLKNGIPAEIEARKKQYEYYREKLLTFKKLEK